MIPLLFLGLASAAAAAGSALALSRKHSSTSGFDLIGAAHGGGGGSHGGGGRWSRRSGGGGIANLFPGPYWEYEFDDVDLAGARGGGGHGGGGHGGRGRGGGHGGRGFRGERGPWWWGGGWWPGYTDYVLEEPLYVFDDDVELSGRLGMIPPNGTVLEPGKEYLLELETESVFDLRSLLHALTTSGLSIAKLIDQGKIIARPQGAPWLTRSDQARLSPGDVPLPFPRIPIDDEDGEEPVLFPQLSAGPVVSTYPVLTKRRVRFMGYPRRRIALGSIPRARWTLARPYAISAGEDVSFIPRPVALQSGTKYDLRILSGKQDPRTVRKCLELGFANVEGPYLLQRGIHHPALRGELSDWIAKGTWTQPSTVLADGGFGPILIQQIAKAA